MSKLRSEIRFHLSELLSDQYGKDYNIGKDLFYHHDRNRYLEDQ